jgi:hypothetical protein
MGLLDGLQKAIREGDASFLGQKRGYKDDKIVDVLEFIENREYYNLGEPLWAGEREDLWRIWHEKPTPLIVVLTGGQGTCKSSTCAMSLAYMVYLLSRWHNPQAELRMLPIDEIFIIIQSFKLETAEDAIYTRILRGVDASPYFQKHFPRNKKLSSELKFPHNIVLKPITGTINAIQSKNVVGGAVTEINEMKVHKTSVELAHTDKQVLDVGQEVFHNFRNRVRGRFTAYINTGDFICRIHIDSARRYLADFTDRMTKEAETDTTICVIERSLWSARPFDYIGQPKFPVELATEYRPARILLKLEDAEQWSDEFNEEPEKLTNNDWLRDNLNVILVPEGHRKDMETDLEDGLRDFAGVPAAATGRFIPYPKEITAAHTLFKERTGGASLFLVESVVLKKDMPWHEIINYDYVNQLLLEGEFNWSVHLDASLGVKDAAGLGFDRIVDEMVVEKGYFYDPQSQQLRSVENVVMPIHCCDGVLELLAPPGDHLDLLALQDLVIEIKHHINVKWATADWLQSESTIQTWRNHGIISGSQSVDKKPGAYFIFRHAIRDGRMLVPWHSVLDRETRQLKRITNRGEIKIDHPANGSKNCVDAVCGAVATCNRFFRIRPADPPKQDNSTPPSMQPQHAAQRRYGSRRGWGRI